MDLRHGGVPSPQSKALDLISVAVTNGPPPAVAQIAGQDTVITAPWAHPAIHDDVPALPVHILCAYHGARGAGTWRNGQMRLEGTGRPGAFALVPAHFGGRWDVDGAAPISYVMLTERRLQEIADENLPRSRRVELVPRLGEPDRIAASILRALSRHAARPERVESILVEQTLNLLCWHLLRVHASTTRPLNAVTRRGLLPWQVRRVAAYMRDRLDQEMSLNELAGVLNLSRFHFCTAFRLATGQTPHEWLTARRIERARELLGNPSLRITDIALAVGYGTPSAFAARFRRALGVTPTGYRRSL